MFEMEMEPTINLPATIETASPALSTMTSNEWLRSLPARIDDTTLAKIQSLATAALPSLSPCDEEHFTRCLRALSGLPRRAADNLGGKLMVSTYRRMLGHHSAQAIDFLCLKVLAECEWFPSIAECLKIIERWNRNDDAMKAKNLATRIARDERQARLDETMAALEHGDLDGETIAALPERWRAIAETRCLIWADPDGTYRPRPLRRTDPERRVA
jgi:hypothetical protein